MNRRTVDRAALNAAALAAIAVFAFPVYWMVSTAFKPTMQIQSDPPVLVPTDGTVQHFITAVTKADFPVFLRNSLIVTLSAVALAVAVALLAAVAVARMQWRGRKAYVLMVIAVQMAPFEALLIPFFIVFRQYDLLNRLPALILVYFVTTMPFTIWMLRGFVASVPVELEEAAMVDGCSRFKAFLRVVLPLLGPGLVATSIYGFITAWNEFLYAFVFMERENQTLPVWLSSFRTAFGTDWGAIMAGSTLFTLPVLVFFLLVHRRMVAGLTAGAVKG